MKILINAIIHLGTICILWVLIAGSAYATSTADHTKFKELQASFNTGPDVTRACIKCHTEAAKQIHKTKHWTWEFLNPDNKQRVGKRNILNNFCITPQSNFAYCSACHVGYGWKDENYDFTSDEIESYASNLATLADNLKETFNLEMIFMAVPNKYTLYSGKVNNDLYKGFIPDLQDALDRKGVKYVDLYSNFSKASEVLYYGTDTHWNKLGVDRALELTLASMKDYLD